MNERGGMHTPSRRKWAIGGFLCVLFIALVGWAAFAPERKPDMAKVDPRISELQGPMKIEVISYLWEIDNCGFWIEDHTGKTLVISVLKSRAGAKVYIVDAKKLHSPIGGGEIADPSENILFIQNLLRTYAPMDEHAKRAIRFLSDRTVDKGFEQVVQWTEKLGVFFERHKLW